MTAPSGSVSTSSAAAYSTTGGQGTRVSEPTVAQTINKRFAVRTAGSGVEHLAVDRIVFLSDITPVGCAPGVFTSMEQLQEKQQDRCDG